MERALLRSARSSAGATGRPQHGGRMAMVRITLAIVFVVATGSVAWGAGKGAAGGAVRAPQSLFTLQGLRRAISGISGASLVRRHGAVVSALDQLASAVAALPAP